MPSDNGWAEWCKHVLAELERLNDCYERLDEKMNNHLQHNEARLTAIETSLKNQRWAFGIIASAIIGLCLACLSIMFG